MTPEVTRLACPLPRCRALNDVTAEACQACGTPLRAWARLRAHPANLFNEGLRAARSGHTATARDHFAAIVHWCPGDADARSALALACLLLDDPDQARHHWQQVLASRPNDATARQGLAHLDSRAQPEAQLGEEPGAESGAASGVKPGISAKGPAATE